MHRNSNNVFTQKMTPMGKTPVYHSASNEWLDVSESSKITTRYPTHKVDCSEQRIANFNQHKVDEIVKQARAKKGRKPAWLKMFK